MRSTPLILSLAALSLLLAACGRDCREDVRLGDFEFSQGNYERAEKLYRQAWEIAKDDYDACIAAHYVARFQKDPQDVFYWNQEALKRANSVEYERVKDFFPSLYLNMGHSFELIPGGGKPVL